MQSCQGVGSSSYEVEWHMNAVSSKLLNAFHLQVYVVLLERKSKYDVGSFQLFGYQKGLSAGNEGGAMVQDEATGYWLVTMATQEPWAEIEFNIDSYADNKEIFDALITGAMQLYS